MMSSSSRATTSSKSSRRWGDVAQTLAELHVLTFFDNASVPRFEEGWWWLGYRGDEAVAFAGVVPSTHARHSGYFCRVGVLQKHWGHALQLRLMRAVEARARRNGWVSVVSDTTNNPASANNFIKAGYLLYEPKVPWGWTNTLYWRKGLTE
jgi:GNAT superfamily N-acetyltransferase